MRSRRNERSPTTPSARGFVALWPRKRPPRIRRPSTRTCRSRPSPRRGPRMRHARCASCARRARASGLRVPSPRRTSCARACVSSVCRTRRSWSCSVRPATSPIARSSRPCTTCGGRTCCRTSSCCWPSDGGSMTTAPSATRSGDPSSSSVVCCLSTSRRGDRSRSASATTGSISRTPPASTRWLRSSMSSTSPRARAGTGCTTSRPSRRSSRRSSASSVGSASTTNGTMAVGAGSSSRSRSGTTWTRRRS